MRRSLLNTRQPQGARHHTSKQSNALSHENLFFSFGLGTRDPGGTLSTFYRAVRGHSLSLVGRDGGNVPLFDLTERRFVEVRIGFVPVKAGKVFLGPGRFENFAMARVNLITHLTYVFEEKTVQQAAGDELCANLVVQLIFVSDDQLD